MPAPISSSPTQPSKLQPCSRADIVLSGSGAPRPAIDPAIEILPSTDLDDAWDRFEVFEALHHNWPISSPLSNEQLDQAIDATGVTPGQLVLDAACGYGEFLLRAAKRAPISGVGIDLSPWMITTAHQRARQAASADLHWVLGDARNHRLAAPPDIAICVGAEWVWHDFNGTARALSSQVKDGGVVVIGAARLHKDADQAQVRQHRGAVESIDDQAAALERHGLVPVHRVDPDDSDWDRYLARTAAAAANWAGRFPGPRSDQWRRDQIEWQVARNHDRGIMGWSLWIARKQPSSE